MLQSSSFLKTLVDIECVKFGDFKLKSGLQSPVYVDLRNIISYPQLLAELARLFQPQIAEPVQRICGVPYAALPIATAVSMQTGLPMLIKRKEAKNYGAKKIIEGIYHAGDRILLIEDVITSGESLLETIKELEAEGLIIEQIIVALDREQGGSEILADKGYAIKSLFTITSLIEILFAGNKIDEKTYQSVLRFIRDNKSGSQPGKGQIKTLAKTHPHSTAQKLLDIAHSKKSNLIASADLTTATDILEFLNRTGDKICAAKLHIDIVSDFNADFITEIKQLAADKNFLLIEDRKFADIGNTQLLQLSRGIYHIASWADMVTIHLIAGEAALKAIHDWDNDNKPALIPVIEMSGEGALTGKEYIEKCKSFMYRYRDVIGAVCQCTSLENNLLKLTPGIHLSSDTDGKGQNYHTPKYAIETLQSDFLIIGRGLYASGNPSEEIEKYLHEVRSLDFF